MLSHQHHIKQAQILQLKIVRNLLYKTASTLTF